MAAPSECVRIKRKAAIREKQFKSEVVASKTELNRSLSVSDRFTVPPPDYEKFRLSNWL
jgi:hypothetical protein